MVEDSYQMNDGVITDLFALFGSIRLLDHLRTQFAFQNMAYERGWRMYVPIGILFTINMLNYMDRYTIAGVLDDIQTYFNINDAQGGAIQSMFMAFYIVFSPTMGFLGDRYNRKWIMTVGIALWVIIVFSSTMIPRNMFWLFLILRGMVGIGEASYAICTPSVIADMYTGIVRSRMLMIFYFATPFGSGLGYVIGAEVASAVGGLDGWKWGVRTTTIFGIICVLLMILFIREPERGLAERELGIITAEVKNTNYLADLWALCKNVSYVTSSLGYTAIVFGVGSLSWWFPTAVEHWDACKQGLNSTSDLDDDTKGNINLMFGALTCVSGLLGVTMGTLISNFMQQGKGPFRHIQTMRSDPIICGVGALIGIPTMFLGIFLINRNMPTMWVMVFIATCTLSFNWATNVDLLISVVIPSRRNTANAFQILTSHLFGDGSGPYILGAISDWIRGSDDTPCGHFHSLQVAFYVTVAVLVLAAILYLICAIYILHDQAIFAKEMGALRLQAPPVQVDKKEEHVEDESGSRRSTASIKSTPSWMTNETSSIRL